MVQAIFHPLVNSAPDGPISKFRTFVGDGTPQLIVPGLLEVEAVRVGTVDIPLTLKEDVLVDLSEAAKTEEHEHEMIRLESSPDGTPVLLRSIKSNDGIWQPGVTVFVAGKWADEVPATKADKKQPTQ